MPFLLYFFILLLPAGTFMKDSDGHNRLYLLTYLLITAQYCNFAQISGAPKGLEMSIK